MSLRDDRILLTKSDFIETDTGNKVSRRCHIYGSQNIILGGKTIIHASAILRGDLRRPGSSSGHSVAITIGKYSYIGESVIVRPPYKLYKGAFSYYPCKMGDCVHIGSNSIVEAATIGNLVEIGKNCIIGRFVIIKDCAKIADGAVVAPGTVVPSMTVFGGQPAKFVSELPETWPELMEAQSKQIFNNVHVS